MGVRGVDDRGPPELASLVHDAVFEAAPVAILRSDGWGTTLEANPRAAELLGVPADQLVGRSFVDFTHPEHREADAAKHVLLMTGQADQVQLETRWVHADGHDVWVDLTVTVLRASDGRIDFVFGMAVDITARRAAELERARSEAVHRSFFEDNASVMLLIDPEDERIVDANRSAAEFYGWSVETLRSMRITDINQLPPEQVQAELRQAKTHKKKQFFFPHRLASGEVRAVEVHVSHLYRDGRLVVLSIIHDVAERQEAKRALAQSEARLRRTESIVGVGGWELLEGQLGLQVSPGFRDIFGLDLDAEVDEGFLTRRVDAEQRATFAAAWRRARARSEPFDLELPMRGAGDEARWLRVRAECPPRGARGLVLVGAVVDLTERRRVEEEREAALHAVEAAARARSEFLATMSHEIRTPMNGVLGMADALCETRLDRTQREMLDTVRSSGAALMRVIDDVLDMSRIEAGHLHIQDGRVELARLGAELVRLYRPGAEAKGLALRLTVDPALPAAVTADGDRLHQVLANLVSNAVKYTEAGVITLALEATAEAKLRFSVSDTGVGIAEDQLPSLFERFVQLGKERTGSTGLGLAISKRLVSAMGSEIEVRSALGVGSCFAFELPIRDAPAFAAVSGPHAGLAASLALKVLVVDDNPVNRRVIEMMLRKLGHTVQVAEDGGRALELWRERAWDLVLMDVYMPGLDGLEATRRIRAEEAARCEPGRTRIVAVTASPFPAEQEGCTAAGMDGFLTKPVRRAALLSALDEAAAGA